MQGRSSVVTGWASGNHQVQSTVGHISIEPVTESGTRYYGLRVSGQVDVSGTYQD